MLQLVTGHRCLRYSDALSERSVFDIYESLFVPWILLCRRGGVRFVVRGLFSHAATSRMRLGFAERLVLCRYDCDFNQQLAMSAAAGGSGAEAPTVFNTSSLEALTGRTIACGNHCYGCTAGSGSSCQGQ